MFFDIHSHILPQTDDGAKDLDESVTLLKMMKKSGISTVLTTPHFYPCQVDYEGFVETVNTAFAQLKTAVNNKKLPEIYLGCELLYYNGMGNSDALRDLCLNKSDFLLLELTEFDIKDSLFEDILNLKSKQKITPIIAHIERYYKAKNFKKLLNFVKENNIPVQINAESVFMRCYKRVICKLLKEDFFCVLATDSHSVTERPPLMNEAYLYIRDNYGSEYRKKLKKNADKLYQYIIGEKCEK